jgi:hypothetical protein
VVDGGRRQAAFLQLGAVAQTELVSAALAAGEEKRGNARQIRHAEKRGEVGQVLTIGAKGLWATAGKESG